MLKPLKRLYKPAISTVPPRLKPRVNNKYLLEFLKVTHDFNRAIWKDKNLTVNRFTCLPVA
jgi:hypothetical protein